MTFTSDKTTPTTDAGAQVTTGKIAFSEDGSVSYQYVKCVMTSKVNPDGATITDVLDVNVGEVEVQIIVGGEFSSCDTLNGDLRERTLTVRSRHRPERQSCGPAGPEESSI